MLKDIGLYSMVILCAVLLNSCEQMHSIEPQRAGMIILGEDAKTEIVQISQHPESGFVIGANTWKDNQQDFWIIRCDDNLNVIWESRIGGKGNEAFQHLFIDKDLNILTCGTTDSYGQDTFPLTQRRRKLIFLGLLDQNGKRVWNNTYLWEYDPIWGYYNLTFKDEFVSNCLQDENGNYILGCDIGRVRDNSQFPIYESTGSILRINPQGEFLDVSSQYITSTRGLFHNDSSYRAFLRHNREMKVFDFDVNRLGDFDIGEERSSAPIEALNYWSVLNKLFYERQDGTIECAELYQDALYKYTWNSSNQDMETKKLNLIHEDVSSASVSSEGTYLLCYKSGLVQEFDQNLHLKHEFEIGFTLTNIGKLADGTYLAGFNSHSDIGIVHFGQEGVIDALTKPI